MRKKKILSLILAGALSASLLSGWADNAAFGSEGAESEVNSEGNAFEKDREISLESVAQLNGVEVNELNTVIDEDQNIRFIGNKLSEETIQDEAQALSFIEEKLAALLDLDDITLADGESYTSLYSGITYYRFNQALPGEIEAKMPDGTFGTLSTNMEYLPYSLKLGVDPDGFPVVLASDLIYDIPELDADNFLSPEEAEAIVTELIPNAHIYSDATSLALWEDETARTSSNDATAAVVYLIYADNPDLQNDPSASPYLCFEVRAVDDPGTTSNGFVGVLMADSLSTYSYTDVDNTASVYFDDMEDVGAYTYTVNFDWMSESNKACAEAYAGTDGLEITVPVMRCKTDGLYYLGQKEHYISMSNAVDFYSSAGYPSDFNPYVTDDPEDLESWHFKKAGDEANSVSYMDDPNYVLASFAEYVKVINTFGENFGMFEAFPSDSYMLLTYNYDFSGGYPTDTEGFNNVTSYDGILYDWNTFNTSPNDAGCLDDVTMCHEYTHLVNHHFTNTRYVNEQGAVMESLADMVGYQMAAVYLIPQLAEQDDWYFGGLYSYATRNLSDPLSMDGPEYKDGVFYVNPVDSTIVGSDWTDRGGVHQNSLIPSFLGTQFVKGSPEEGESTLSLEENLKLWYEVLYISNYSTDFINLGADLAFAAKELDFSEEELAYVNRLIQEFGFEDGTVDQVLLDSENSDTVMITLDFENPDMEDYYYFFDGYTNLGENTVIDCGGFTANTEQTIRVSKDEDYPVYKIYAQSEQEVANGVCYVAYMNAAEMGDRITFHVKEKVDVPEGETLTLENTETVVNLTPDENPNPEQAYIGAYRIEEDATSGETILSADSPDLQTIITKEDGYAQGEYNLYLVDFE